MKTLLFLLLAILFGMGFLAPVSAAERPNIILIMVDDMEMLNAQRSKVKFRVDDDFNDLFTDT